MDFHVYDDLASYDFDSSVIMGYYEVQWDEPVVDYTWEIDCCVWLLFPDNFFTSTCPYMYGCQAVEDCRNSFNTTEKVSKHLEIFWSKNNDVVEIPPNGWGATFINNNRLQIHIPVAIDTSFPWFSYDFRCVVAKDVPDSTMVINQKTDYWDQREFKLTLTKPSEVLPL